MKQLALLIERGGRYFDSGSHNSPQFDKFFLSFKNSFTRELKKIKATEIEFHKGHFYLYGFFKIGEQLIYFSISDVRHFMGVNRNGFAEMLVRTAKDNKDFSGGSNNYVDIDTHMSREIARIFGMPELFSKPETKKFNRYSVVEKAIKTIEKTGGFKATIPSAKQANFIAWEVLHRLGLGSTSITVSKYGRTISRMSFDVDGLSYNYDAGAKVLRLTADRTDEQLISQLSLGNKPEFIKNMFDPTQGIELDPLGVALHDYIKGCEVMRMNKEMKQGLRIFAEKYPEAYMVLLD